MLPSPVPREKSPELKARLAELQRQLDDRNYNTLRYDITKQAGRYSDCSLWLAVRFFASFTRPSGELVCERGPATGIGLDKHQIHGEIVRGCRSETLQHEQRAAW